MLPAVFGSALARRCWQHLCEYVVFRLSLEICVKPISQLIIVEHCFFGDCVLCAVEVYLQRKNLVDCVVVSLRIVERTVFEAVPDSRSLNMSHVPAGLVGSSCWHTCMEYSKATRTASVEVCLHDRYTLR